MENPRNVLQEFIRSALRLGIELLEKDELTKKEKKFLSELDKLEELLRD